MTDKEKVLGDPPTVQVLFGGLADSGAKTGFYIYKALGRKKKKKKKKKAGDTYGLLGPRYS